MKNRNKLRNKYDNHGNDNIRKPLRLNRKKFSFSFIRNLKVKPSVIHFNFSYRLMINFLEANLLKTKLVNFFKTLFYWSVDRRPICTDIVICLVSLRSPRLYVNPK